MPYPCDRDVPGAVADRQPWDGPLASLFRILIAPSGSLRGVSPQDDHHVARCGARATSSRVWRTAAAEESSRCEWYHTGAYHE
jgi:hypothetical protein